MCPLGTSFLDINPKEGESELVLYYDRKTQWRQSKNTYNIVTGDETWIYHGKGVVVFCVMLSRGGSYHKNSTKLWRFFLWRWGISPLWPWWPRHVVQLMQNGTWKIVFPKSSLQVSHSTKSPRESTTCCITTIHLRTWLAEHWIFWKRKRCKCCPIHLTWPPKNSFLFTKTKEKVHGQRMKTCISANGEDFEKLSVLFCKYIFFHTLLKTSSIALVSNYFC